jgi:hypothetical protein
MIGLYEESQFNSGGQANRLAVLIDCIHKSWTIGKAVQAYLSNRLVVLTFHELVLSDKVKGNRFQLYEKLKLWYGQRS